MQAYRRACLLGNVVMHTYLISSLPTCPPPPCLSARVCAHTHTGVHACMPGRLHKPEGHARALPPAICMEWHDEETQELTAGRPDTRGLLSCPGTLRLLSLLSLRSPSAGGAASAAASPAVAKVVKTEERTLWLMMVGQALWDLAETAAVVER